MCSGGTVASTRSPRAMPKSRPNSSASDTTWCPFFSQVCFWPVLPEVVMSTRQRSSGGRVSASPPLGPSRISRRSVPPGASSRSCKSARTPSACADARTDSS